MMRSERPISADRAPGNAGIWYTAALAQCLVRFPVHWPEEGRNETLYPVHPVSPKPKNTLSGKEKGRIRYVEETYVNDLD